MDFNNERYIRLYVRDTLTWKRLGWHGQNVLSQILRRMDLSGVLDIEGTEPWEAAVIFCGAPEDDAKVGMALCLKLGCFIHNGSHLVAPRYREANEANKSDRQRQLESRERRRLDALRRETAPGRHQMGTTGHTPSGADTPRHALSHADTNRDNGQTAVTERDSSVTSRDESSHAVTRGHTPSQSVTPTGSGSGSDAIKETNGGSGGGGDLLAREGLNGSGPEPAAAAQKLRSEDVAAAWNREAGSLTVAGHAHAHWEVEFFSIAAVCNEEAVRDSVNPRVVLEALLGYFWRAPAGAVSSGRVPAHKADPGQLAKRISRDLHEASAWYAQQKLSRETGAQAQ